MNSMEREANEVGSSDLSNTSITPDFSFHPAGEFGLYWNLIGVLIYIYFVLYIPFAVAFRWNPLGMRILNSCFDAFFCLDMVVVCRTGIIERRKENDERFISFITSHVVKRYLRTWFFIDLVATIPWKNVYEVAYHSGFNMGMASWQVRMLELVRLVRVVRIITMRKNLGRWEDVLQVGGFCGG